MDLEQVKATLARGNEAIEEATTLISITHEKVQQAQTLAVSTGHDSTDKDLELGIKKLHQALTESSRARTLFAAAVASADEYASRL
jgi:hypothetical protein